LGKVATPLPTLRRPDERAVIRGRRDPDLA
jgi:hypothetical protein